MKNLLTLLKELYPEKYQSLFQRINKKLSCKGVKKIDTDWYRRMRLYVTYPNSFKDNKGAGISQLTKEVDKIKKLGCNAIHVLPFFKSPMIDMGFDVSNYLKVREELGGNQAFDVFLDKCERENIKVFIDIVLNHVSFQHHWFKKAVQGDSYYKDFFISREEKPRFIKTFQKNGKTWARYKFKDQNRDIFLIFPDQAGEIPHWYQGKDGDWYYHTFYPHQIDVDWNNPEVFYEFAKILIFWARKGVSFRLDAIPFIGKDIEAGVFTKDQRTQKIVQALNLVVKQESPDSVFLSEVAFELEKIKTYFGADDLIESELSYNFPLNAKFWLSILQQDSSHIWEILNRSYKNIPGWAEWVNFIRNHDALMVDRMEKEQTNFVLEELKECGLPFAGNTNVCGRTFSFVGENVKRHLMAYFLLFSLPGCPAIIYGDEYGKCNDHQYMEEMVEVKKKKLRKDQVAEDTRDINRGQINKATKKTQRAGKIYQKLAEMLEKRTKIESIIKNKAESITKDSEVFSAKYSDALIVINLSDKKKSFKLEEEYQVLCKINDSVLDGKRLELNQYSGIWLI
jgi:maltose alpha-D-glucosyltransferase/alpha-amylase